MNKPTQDSIDVLLVEDDPGDVELTRELLAQTKIAVNLYTLEDGEQAVSYLLGKCVGGNLKGLPDLILLDLNMPRRNGKEVLEVVKTHPILKMIPIVVLTTSSADKDILESYRLGANCYVTKPVGFREFSQIVQSIEGFWFTITKLPTRTRHDG